MWKRRKGVQLMHIVTHVTTSWLTHTYSIYHQEFFVSFLLLSFLTFLSHSWCVVLIDADILGNAAECWPSYFACTAEKTWVPVHCEDSQLLKHRGCTAAEDTAGKVPQQWIPPLPQKPQTLHVMPATERKRQREERGRQDQSEVGEGWENEKIREHRVKVGESKGRRRYGEWESPVRLGWLPK